MTDAARRYWPALIITIPLLIVLPLLLFGNGTAQNTEPLPPSKYDARLAELDREAIDNAYRAKIEQLFDGWLRDPTGQPDRALAGARAARRAYIDAMTALERELEKRK